MLRARSDQFFNFPMNPRRAPRRGSSRSSPACGERRPGQVSVRPVQTIFRCFADTARALGVLPWARGLENITAPVGPCRSLCCCRASPRWQPAVRSPRRSSLRRSRRPSPRRAAPLSAWLRAPVAAPAPAVTGRRCFQGRRGCGRSPECGPTLVRDCGSRPDGSLAASRRSTRRCSFRPAALSAPGSPGWIRACCPRGCTRGRCHRAAARTGTPRRSASDGGQVPGRGVQRRLQDGRRPRRLLHRGPA